ncbi:MAG: response regulator [Pseudomonadota bacterium]
MRPQFTGTFMAPATPKILAVDDDPHVRRLLSRQLSLLGCEAEFAENASGFLARLSQPDSVYDLAIIDINLPGVDGREIITWMRESDLSSIRCLPIVIITGFLEWIPSSFLSENGRCRILTKPYSHSDLKHCIAECAGRVN